MKTHLIPCIKITLLTVLMFGMGYPLLVTIIIKFTARGGGDGVRLEANGRVVGFDAIGQSFVADHYFSGRPSAVGYNAASTGGSNKGPSTPEYLAQVDKRIQDFLSRNPGVDKSALPVDLVTASGGGLDPHISPAAATVQISRVARARGVSEESLNLLIKQNTSTPLFRMLGTPTVHVLRLNIALDNLK